MVQLAYLVCQSLNRSQGLHVCVAASSVAAFFTVPFTKARKKYLDELAQGMDTAPAGGAAAASATCSTLGGGGGGGGGGAHRGSAGGTRNHDAEGRRRRGPFPPRHYAAAPAELEANEFPVLRPGAGGALEPPDGFLVTEASGTPTLHAEAGCGWGPGPGHRGHSEGAWLAASSHPSVMPVRCSARFRMDGGVLATNTCCGRFLVPLVS